MEGENKTIAALGDNFFCSNKTADRRDINETFSMAPQPFSHPFSDPVSRAILIVSYSVVFLACIIGNVLVLFVITRNRRMRTRTNVFLANLAIADLCVGIVCIFPNMLKYLFLNKWFLGKVICKVFQFVKSMNITASMLLLEVVAIERYIAINHPLKARRVFTRKNMYFAQFTVWIVSSIYNVPVLIMYDLHEFCPQEDNTYAFSFCYPDDKFQLPQNTLAIYDTITFVIWYLLPLLVMTVLYASMAKTLRRSTLTNYIETSLSNNRQVPASLSLSPQARTTTEPLGKNELTTLTLRATTKSRLDQTSISSATTFESSPSKQSRLPTELELFKIYDQYSLTKNKTDQTIQLQHRNIHKIMDSKPGDQELTKYPLASSSSSSSEDDPFICNHKDGQLKENMFKTTQNGESEKVNPLDKLLNTSGRSSPLTPLSMRNTHNSTSSCGSLSGATTSNRNCRYRLTSKRASRRRVIRLLIIVLTSFALLVLPHHVILLVTTFQQSLGFGSFTGPLCDLAMFLNSALNPVLYNLFSQSFRRNLKQAIRCCKCNNRSLIRKPKAMHQPVKRVVNIADTRALK